MKIAFAVFVAALLFLAGVVWGLGRSNEAHAPVPRAIEMRNVGSFERGGPDPRPSESPSVDEVEHDVDESDDSGRGRGRGRGRGGDDDDDEDRSGSNSGSG